MKICILGAGALGSTFGAWLSEAGHDTWLLNRPNAHLDAIAQDGLEVTTADGTRRLQVRTAVDAEAVGVVDLVVVLVKSFATTAAMTQARALVGPHTLVLSLQNGLGHEELLAEIVGQERVIAGKTYVGGVLLGPGQIRSGVVGKRTIIGELDGQLSARVQAVAAVFDKAGTSSAPSGTSCWSTSPPAPSPASPSSAMASFTASRCCATWRCRRWARPSPWPASPGSS